MKERQVVSNIEKIFEFILLVIGKDAVLCTGRKGVESSEVGFAQVDAQNGFGGLGGNRPEAGDKNTSREMCLAIERHGEIITGRRRICESCEGIAIWAVWVIRTFRFGLAQLDSSWTASES